MESLILGISEHHLLINRRFAMLTKCTLLHCVYSDWPCELDKHFFNPKKMATQTAFKKMRERMAHPSLLRLPT